MQLGPSPANIAVARRWAGERIAEWGDPDVVDRLQLVVSELVTNAVVHAGTGCELTLRVVGPVLTIEVTDGSPEQPTVREAGTEVEDLGGRGLHIVEAFTLSWGSRPTGTAKTVWAEMALSTV